MIQATRKKGETFDALLRRFQRRFQQSGKQTEAKSRRFYHVGKNRNERRWSALRREQKRAEYAYLLKTGQLKEEPKKRPVRH